MVHVPAFPLRRFMGCQITTGEIRLLSWKRLVAARCCNARTEILEKKFSRGVGTVWFPLARFPLKKDALHLLQKFTKLSILILYDKRKR
jgi:hypothetical protein